MVDGLFGLGLFRPRRRPAQQSNRKNQNQDQYPKQAELDHGRAEDTLRLSCPGSALGKSGHFKSDNKDAPDGCNETNYEKRLGNKDVRTNRNAYGVEDFDDHQDKEKMVENLEDFRGNGPSANAIP